MQFSSTKTYNSSLHVNRKAIILKLSFFSFCLITILVSTTQIFPHYSSVFAEGNNTVSSSSSAHASVTVAATCSLSVTRSNGYSNDNGYTGILANNSTIEILGSTFTTYCNDIGGYAIYAIGYTNNEYGNTDLIYNNEPTSTYNIKTDGDTLAGGNGSSWKMKLSPVENSFTPTIENDYNNYSNIPSNYTKIASYNNVTINDSDSTTGSSITATYQATASGTQPAGTYTGAVKYTMVHPSATPAAYFMQDVADWADELPNPGDTFQAVDRRDGKVYWVARLADGNIWMTQNLDLDITLNTTLNSEVTDLNVVYNSATGQYAEYDDGYSAQNGIIYWTPASSAITRDFASTAITSWQNSSTEPYSASKTDDTNIGHASLGNYYNWTAAIASNDSGSLTANSFGNIANNPKNSICPKGWRLPTISSELGSIMNSTNEFARLNYLYNNDLTDSSNNLIISPLWFTKAGYFYSGSIAWITEGFYASSTYNGVFNYLLGFKNGSVQVDRLLTRDLGYSIRCLARTKD